MKKRYKGRVRYRWKPIFTILLVINVVFAVRYSRVTAIRHITLIGVRADENDRIENILYPLRGVPYPKVDATAIETEALREPSVRRATFTHNAWGGATLKLSYRKPVARLAKSSTLALDDEGVVFSAPDLTPDLPTLSLPGGGPPTLAGMAMNWHAQRFADLAVRIRAYSPKRDVGIEVDERGQVCLNMNPGRVDLGSSEDLGDKMDILEKRLRANPNELAGVQKLVLTDPKNPTFVPLVTSKDQKRDKEGENQ